MEKLTLIVEAMDDHKRGILTDLSLWTVIAGIVYPPAPITEDIMKWALDSIKEQEKQNV